MQEIIERENIREQKFKETWNGVLGDAFTDLSSYYDAANNVASLGMWNKWRKDFTSGIALTPGMRVLDVCAGTNAVSIQLLKKQPELRITTIDRSQAMQEVGEERIRRLGFEVESVISDVHKLPFPDNTFDTVILEAASRHLRLVEVFSEVLRVLKPGGSFHHCDMLKPSSKLLEQAYLTYLKASMFATGRIFRSKGNVWSCADYFIEAIREFYTPEELSRLMRYVGFVDVTDRSIFGGIVAFHEGTHAALNSEPEQTKHGSLSARP